ncbi:radical SAM protein [Thermococcus sp. M39]|nr:radical SAM protein [Thermococcus sp. M39]
MIKQRRLRIDWHLTYNCNLNCLHCGVVEYRDRDFIEDLYLNNNKSRIIDTLRQQDLDLFINLLENDSKYLFSIHFSPNIGESTTHPDFVNIWNNVSSVDRVYMLAITTNGMTLYKYLPRMNVEKLRTSIFSLDGDENTHDKIRGNGTFKKTYRSIQKIDELKQEDSSFYLQINFVINKINAVSLKELPLLLNELNSKNIVINVIPIDTTFGNARINRKLLEIQISEIANSINDAYKQLKTINAERIKNGKSIIKIRLMAFTSKQALQIVSKIQNLSFSDFIIPHKGWKESCSAYNQKGIYLDPYGNLFPCESFTIPHVLARFYSTNGYMPIPNIYDGFSSIEEIVHSQFFLAAKKWINELYDFSICNSCPMKKSCTVCPIYSSIWGVPHDCSAY